jgi:hypothetical protein
MAGDQRTPHSTAFFSNTLSTVSTLLTVFAERCASVSLSRCTCSFGDRIKRLVAERRQQMPFLNGLCRRDAARLLAIGAHMTVEKARGKISERGNLLGELSRPVLHQVPLTLLAPTFRGRLAGSAHPGAARGYVVHWRADSEYRPAILPDTVALARSSRFYLSSDGVVFWRNHSSRSASRNSRRRPIRTTPGSWRARSL